MGGSCMRDLLGLGCGCIAVNVGGLLILGVCTIIWPDMWQLFGIVAVLWLTLPLLGSRGRGGRSRRRRYY